MKKRIIRMAGVSMLGLAVFISTFILYRHFTHTESKYTLREALWTSDTDMKHFYPPYSPQSQAIVEVFKQAAMETDKKSYQEYVLYRMGLTTSDEPTKSLLIIGFQPPKE
jgi:hypothetical protein